MIHPLSNVHPEAKIAASAIIEAFATVDKDVTVGENTWVGSGAVLMNGARIGNNCKIHQGAVIAGVPQDLKFVGEVTTAEIGDNTTVREYVTVNRGTNAKHKTVIGQNCLIMSYVHVAHDCVIGNNVILVSYVALAGEVEVDDWAIVGGKSAAHQFTRIGAHAMISGGSLIGKDVPPYTKAAHNPLSYVGINIIGLRRRGFTPEQTEMIHNIYRIVYQSGLNTTNALAKAEAELPVSEDRDYVLNFIRNSKRGIMKGYKGKETDFEL